MSQKRRKIVGDMRDLQRVMWRTICEVEDLLATRPPDTQLVLRAAHALAQLGKAYKGVVEMADIEARLRALEASAEGE